MRIYLRPVAAAVKGIARCRAHEGCLAGSHQPHRHVHRLGHLIHPRVELQRPAAALRAPCVMHHLANENRSNDRCDCKRIDYCVMAYRLWESQIAEDKQSAHYNVHLHCYKTSSFCKNVISCLAIQSKTFADPQTLTPGAVNSEGSLKSWD